MSTPSTLVHDAALAIPDLERADLAYKLLQSLTPPKMLSVGSSELETELERRVDAFEAGTTSAADWDTVSTRLRQALDDKKQ